MLRLGFLGTGWIGRHRMGAILATGEAEAVAVADPSVDGVREALALAPGAQTVSGLDEMLALGLDGVVIATPSALHAAQSVQALNAGVSAFCQKPLGRSADEVEAVIAAARKADRLLGVDLSYRHLDGTRAIRGLVEQGALGEVFAVDLVFHNAYGPDKPWFYDRAQSGGGCLIDLGVHLVDLALWTLGFPATERFDARLLAGGASLAVSAVEDYATASFRAGAVEVRLACSWRLPAGQDAVIEAAFYGTNGGAVLRNIGGSFYDFTAERLHGTTRETLASGAEEWAGRAAAAWVRQLAADRGFDPAAEQFRASAAVLDKLYAAGSG